MIVSAGRALKILDFDIENRPLSYWYDRPTAEVTAVAACWVDRPDTIKVWLLRRDGKGKEQMLEGFRKLYDEADMVTGHYITRHDLPILNGEYLEHGYDPLDEKLAQDTKTQLKKRGDIPATQEHLAAMFGVTSAKYHMTQQRWREANRLTPEGLALTRKRVVDDVLQHMELRAALLEADALRPPRIWRP